MARIDARRLAGTKVIGVHARKRREIWATGELQINLHDVDLVWDAFLKHGLADHAHCGFCMVKFPYEAKAGYRAKGSRHWICEEWHEDFKSKFHWKALSSIRYGNG